ncbi:GNAT family N-acetyltransferase [Hyalangium rubrum]|uniref:GNAT family N-acetyltransferase n=1 Tax=Hyalangium rubrum TaxID=3103134 RepID=A0ABU5GWU7_9BACT|nr:GNAT family N-acetyltransferase [Hyalangium sp. s54d21]MDY7225664.1 GNAT family N-acetyltransferase [Hyalangium sp. s54d21]
MSRVRFVLTDPNGIAPYVPELRRLEQSIRYPISDGADHFFIDHGPRYHPFFSNLGEARFLLALRGDRVIGSVAGVMRTVSVGGRPTRALYICDLKVAAEERGQGLSRRLIQVGLRHVIQDRDLRQTRFFYGAAMRGSLGDVMRSAQGAHPFKLGSSNARLRLYFAAPEALARLDLEQAPPPPRSQGAVLGPATPTEEPGLFSTAGSKDLRLVSSGQPWPLIHLPLGPEAWRPSWGAYLRRCGEAIVSRGLQGSACFAIDERMENHISWLSAQGVTPGAVCTVYSLRLSLLPASVTWVHLPTSEI